MPVIAIANPKGGTGKSTTSLVLGTTLAADGASVTVMDCDRNRPIVKWRQGQSTNPVEVMGDVTEDNVLERIDDLRTARQFVIVDLEGTASLLTSRAIMRANLVLVPIQASAVDVEEAVRALRLVKMEERAVGRSIPCRFVFTRTSVAIPSVLERAIAAELQEAGVPMLGTALNERAAFKAILYHKLALDELERMRVNGLPAAQENATRFAADVVRIIKEELSK